MVDAQKKKDTAIAALSAELPSFQMPALAAGIVHEIKNPLAAIHLHLQMLEANLNEVDDADLQDRLKGRVDTIKKEVLSLNEVLQDFIHLIRSEKTVKTTSEGLNEILSAVIRLLEPQARKSGTSIQFEPGDLKSGSELHTGFIKQMVINLILNAIQALEKSSRPAGEREITVSTGREEEQNYIRIHDNGPGISAENQDRIFEPFYTTKDDGSGLGLALVKKMITEMGGWIDVSSDPRHGTSFTIYFGGRPALSESVETND
ncbi:MAG: HAMP domain-containing histidine kinase [Leptospiraceae bacterium]|nr:HAMP domain-containing histidine kinase [Leptospiraceae bacterium]